MTRSIAAVLLVAGLGLAARADVLPPPGALTTYTVELGADLSEVLLASVPFQTSKAVPLASGACKGTTQEKTFQTGDSKIVCAEPTYCMGHVPARCTATFKGYKGQNARDFLKIVGQK